MSRNESSEPRQPAEPTSFVSANGLEGLDLPSNRAMILSAVFLVLCCALVGAAVFGMAHSNFWKVTPVFLRRYLQ
jgi:hypothetical protein